MAILQLRPATPFVLRVGYNDHKSVLDVLRGKEIDGARVPVDVLVMEAHWAQRHRELVKEAAVGRQLVLDCRIDLWTLDGASALPPGRANAYTIDEIHRDAKDIVRDVLAVQYHAVWTIAPACHVDDFSGPAWNTTLRLLDETIDQSGSLPWAKIVGTPAALATRESADRIRDELLARRVEHLVLTIGPIQNDRDGEDVLHLVRALSAAGLRVHLTHQGAFGLAALAVGAQSFDGGLLGRVESFDYEQQRQRLSGNNVSRAPKPRGYAAPLLCSIPKEILVKLFQLKAVRAAFECDGPCCHTRIDGAALHPVTHFVVRRYAQVRQVLDVPPEMRLGQVQTLYDQTETIYTAIRGVRRGDRNALEATELEALSRQVAPVIAARRQLRKVVDSAHWAASSGR